MLDPCSISGKKCLAKAATAGIGAGSGYRLAFALVIFLICAAMPAKATPVPIPVHGLGSLTNGLGDTNGISVPDYVATYLSIDGPGYFVVRDPVTGLLSATRYGPFMFDMDGYLTTQFGKRLQGYDDPMLTVIGDLRIGASIRDSNGLYINSVEIQTNGRVVETFSDGSSAVCGQVLLQNFQNPSSLTAEGWRFYDWSAGVGPLPEPVPPGTSGTGSLVIGALEQLVPKLQISPVAGPPQSFSQGVLVSTAVPTDFGIEGNGFFLLRRTNDNALFATRAGAFYLDGSGFLIHYSGLRLQGYANPASTSIGDMRIDPSGSPSITDPGAYFESFGIDPRGTITEYLSDGTTVEQGQIMLVGCSNPDLITRTNFDLYPLDADAGLWSSPGQPLSGNLGWLVEGTVELSQFDASLVQVRGNLNFFAQGQLIETGIPSNLGIMGLGFFTVRDPVANTLYATRCGGFQLDALGHLETTNGLRVQGFTNGADSQIGDITIDAAGTSDPTLIITNYSIDAVGQIVVSLRDGSEFIRGQIVLQTYRNLQGLSPTGTGLYSNLAAAGPMFTNGSLPGLQGYIQSGAVEQPPQPQPPLQLPPASGIRLFSSDLDGGTLQSSSDLLHWDAIGQISGSPDLNVAEFFATPQSSQTFYRVVSPIY
jgi:flagellar hook protein FlgE